MQSKGLRSFPYDDYCIPNASTPRLSMRKFNRCHSSNIARSVSTNSGKPQNIVSSAGSKSEGMHYPYLYIMYSFPASLRDSNGLYSHDLVCALHPPVLYILALRTRTLCRMNLACCFEPLYKLLDGVDRERRCRLWVSMCDSQKPRDTYTSTIG